MVSRIRDAVSLPRLLVAAAFLLAAASSAVAACGDGILDVGEDCETPFDACCDPGTCLFRTAGTACRTGSGDSCDPDEACTGTDAACPADTVAMAGTVCRAASGDGCNPAELCTGVAGVPCPPDVVIPAAVPCDDARYCTVGDACDGAGSCVGTARDCSDGLFCTVDTCDEGADACVNAPGTCDDTDPCTTDSCSEMSGCSYSSTPFTGCFITNRDRLQVRDDDLDPSKNNIRFRWRKGQDVPLAALGSPATYSQYGICIFDSIGGVPTLAASSGVPAGGSWSSKDTSKGTKVTYSDGSGTWEGTRRVWLRDGAALTTFANWRATGDQTDVPIPYDAFTMFAASPQVLVQIVNSDGACWQSTYTASKIRTNTTTSFVAISK